MSKECAIRKDLHNLNCLVTSMVALQRGEAERLELLSDYAGFGPCKEARQSCRSSVPEIVWRETI